MEGQLNISDIFAILRRRYLYLLAPAIIIAGCAVLVAYMLPPTYEASATILVQSQQIRTDLASSTVTADADERIQIIQQRLLARDNLLQIAGKFSLYDYLGSERSPTAIVDSLRQAVTIAQINPGAAAARRGVGVIGFTVKFKYRDANTASRVTTELVSSILSQNIESRMSSATETSTFFDQQQKDIEKQLLQLEAKIADFKRANEGDLPETLPARRIQVALLTERIGDLDQKIRLANTSVSPAALDGSGGDVQQLGYTLQVKQLELDSLQRERDKIAPLAEKGFASKSQIEDLDQRIAIAQLNIESVRAQIATRGGVTNDQDTKNALQAQRDEFNTQLTAINDSISRTPVVEVELNALKRDYDSLQAQYVQVKAKLQEATTGQRLEQDRQAERFEVIEQATVPEQPSEPNRPRIALLGSFGGVAAGVGLVVLLELLNKSLYSARDLERYLGLRPIAVIPYVTTRSETRLQSSRRLIIFVVLASLVAGALLVVHAYVMPLDLLLDRGWRFASRLLSRVGIQLPSLSQLGQG